MNEKLKSNLNADVQVLHALAKKIDPISNPIATRLRIVREHILDVLKEVDDE